MSLDRNHMRLAFIVAALSAATMLSACGVRGPLETPRSATSDTAQADSGQGKKEGEAPKPHQGFILDGLLR